MQDGQGVLDSKLALNAISCLLEVGLPECPPCVLSLAEQPVRGGTSVQMLPWCPEHSCQARVTGHFHPCGWKPVDAFIQPAHLPTPFYRWEKGGTGQRNSSA